MKEVLISATRSSLEEYQSKIDIENVVRFGIIFIFLFTVLWFTLSLRRKNGVKRKPWRPFQTEGTYQPPKVFYGKRGGRYRIRYNNNGEPYRDYF